MSRSWDGSSPAGVRAAGEVGQGTGPRPCLAPPWGARHQRGCRASPGVPRGVGSAVSRLPSPPSRRRFPLRVPGAHLHQQQLVLQPQGAARRARGGAGLLDAAGLLAPRGEVRDGAGLCCRPGAPRSPPQQCSAPGERSCTGGGGTGTDPARACASRAPFPAARSAPAPPVGCCFLHF